MNASFDLNHAKLAADPRFAGIAHELSALSPINSRRFVQPLLPRSMSPLE
jgi:hypothetical protein